MEAIKNMAMDKWKNILNLEDNLNTLASKRNILSCRASDFKQVVTKAEQTGKKKRKREVENWFEEFEQTEDEFNALKNKVQDGGLWGNVYSGASVAKLVAKVEQLLEQSQYFDGLLIDDHDNMRGVPLVTTKLFGDKFQEGLETIWNWLVTDNLSSIGIYGQAGVGKTTLAKHIHNYLLEETDFNVYWVTVSQEFSIKKLQDDIAKQVNLDLSGEDDEDQRAAKLSRSLVHQQSVLILDDVWEEFCLETIGIALGANKCRLILTTRSLQLCDRMRCQRKFDLKTLNTDDAWNLFKYTLGLETVLTPDVEETAKKVAKMCAGLPLCIIKNAGSMRGVVDIFEWRNVLEQLESSSIGYKEMEDKVDDENDADDNSFNLTPESLYIISTNGTVRRSINSWQKGDVLGNGSFGTVYEGFTDDGFFFAVKEVSLLDQGSRGNQSIYQLEQEISLLSRFCHENIVQYLGTEKDNSKLYIFLELVTKGSLLSLYKKYSLRDSQVSAYTRQILNGLNYLHQRNVVHRDIKCANILVHANGSLKLADFGLAKATLFNDIKSCKGTAYWMAPEVVHANTRGYGCPADIWSLGCTVLEMLTGSIPYSHLEWMQALFRIGKGELPNIPNTLSKDAQDFILKCLQVKPDDRPTAAQLLDHPFVKKLP